MNKQCQNCHKTYKVSDRDLDFYKQIKISVPTFCSECREQRRLAWRNERNLYKRKCDLSGKEIVSVYSGDIKIKVYSEDAWWSDKWDGLEYGQDYNFNLPAGRQGKSFFLQFKNLLSKVPRLALVHPGSENSDYTHCSAHLKNCYLCFDTGFAENSYYLKTSYYVKDCVDCSYCFDNCELCYECVSCYTCYHCIYSYDSYNCTDCAFVYDCRDCADCINCTNLRHKKYCIDNKQYTENIFKQKKAKLLPILSQKNLHKLKEEFNKLKKKAIHNNSIQENCEHCSGNYLKNSARCSNIFGGNYNEDCFYMYDSHYMKNSADCDYGGHTQTSLAYENIGCADTYNGKFLSACWYTSDCEYCDLCMNSKNLFGCIGLKKQEYCIFNKQYSKQSFDKLRIKIIEKMKKDGEWGEFFPAQISPFAYNESSANDYFPLKKEEALAKKYSWREEEEIFSVNQPQTSDVIKCSVSGKLFKMIPQEIEFYKKMQLPFPDKHPNIRHQERLAFRNQRRLWNRQCMCTQPDHNHHSRPACNALPSNAGRCSNIFETTYNPNNTEIVYCEECYNKEIY